MKRTDKKICNKEKKAQIKASMLATFNKRKSQVCKVFECKIVEKRLNKKQREELNRLFVEGKWFYNHVLNFRNEEHVKLSEINTTDIKEVTHFNRDKEAISDKLSVLSSQEKRGILKRMIANEKTIASLVKRGYQDHGNLHFTSEMTCIPLGQYGITYKFKSCNKVKIQRISGTVLVRTGDQLQIADELANANLIKKPDGYYLKVTCFINKGNFKPVKTNGKEIGLDFGIKTSITTSEGEKLDVFVEESERLKKLQRQMFRRVKGSNNRRKTIKLIQREYQKLSNQKDEKANKIYHMLRQYSRIYMQDENLTGWQKGLFGKKVQHSCLGRVKAKLINLSQTVVLDQWIPTTKLCPKCGTINQHITLEDRVFKCGCGYEHDRDIHSANNMITIAKSCFKDNLVPTEHREITLMEFESSTCRSRDAQASKLRRRSEKIAPFRV